MLHILRTEIQASEVKLYTFPPLIYSAETESSGGFGRREEGTQHAAKLQLSVRTKSRTHFVKTCAKVFKCH